eukprot:tig00000514_g1794.t1
MPRLRVLDVDVTTMRFGAERDEIVAFLGSDVARRTLLSFCLELGRPLAKAEAEAIAALPALKRLNLVVLSDKHRQPRFPQRQHPYKGGIGI